MTDLLSDLLKEVAPWGDTPAPTSYEPLPEPTPEQWAAVYREVVLNVHTDHATIQ